MRKRILLTLGLSLLLGLFAGPAATAQTQGKLYDVDLSIPGATVSSFTAALTGQTGVLFSYETDLASKSLGNISIKQSQASLESILTRAFSGKGIAWSIPLSGAVGVAIYQFLSDYREGQIEPARKNERGTNV